MKKWLIIAGVVILIFVGAYLVLSNYAVKFVQAQVEKGIGPGLTIARIKVRITHLSIYGIRFDDPQTKQTFLKVEEVRIYPDLFSFLRKRFRIRECAILNPFFFFYRTREGDLIGPWAPIKTEEKGEASTGKKEIQEKEPLTFKVDRLRIAKGSVDFEDRRVGETPAQIRLREVDFNMEKIEYPSFSSRSPIELKGKVQGKEKTGQIHIKGWVSLKTSDLEASIKMKEVELKTFEPYYRKRISAEVESGNLDMDAHPSIKERVIDVPVKLEVVDLHLKEEGTIFYIPAKTLTSRLKDKGNRIGIQFQIKGNLNDPRFKLDEVFLMRIGFGLAEAIGLPVKIVEAEEGAGLLEEVFKNKGEKR